MMCGTLKNAARLGSTPNCDQIPLICSAEPRGLCEDPRIFDDRTKVPQVFRNPGGSPAQQGNLAGATSHCTAIFSQLSYAEAEGAVPRLSLCLTYSYRSAL